MTDFNQYLCFLKKAAILSTYSAQTAWFCGILSDINSSFNHIPITMPVSSIAITAPPPPLLVR